MKKLLIVLFLALFCLSGCRNDSSSVSNNGQDLSETDPQYASLPDGENILRRENGSLEKIVKCEGGKILWIREYNEKGEFIRYTEYTSYGHFVEQKSRGSVTERVAYYDGNGKAIESISYEYHENGFTKKEIFYSGSGDVKGIYEYDESGFTVKKHIYEKDGENYFLSEIVEFAYNQDRKPLKDLYYRADGSPLCEILYNESGDTVKNTRYNESGELTGYTLYEYSENQTKLREISCNSLEIIYSICEYRTNGSKYRLTNYFENGVPSLIYEYGENGQIVRIEKYDTNENFSSIEEFDESGVRIRYTAFNSDLTSLVYDGNYNIIEGVRYLHQASGTLIKYEYLEGKIRSESLFEDGVSISYSINYDALGKKTSDIRYGANGVVLLRTLYSYGESGNMLTYTQHDANGSVLTYSSDGNIISGVKYVYAKGELYQKLEYKNGEKSKETIYSGKAVVLISDYDENGSLRKESFYASGKVSRVKEYDANGVLRKDTIYNDKGKVTSVIRYNEKGNKI